MQATSMQALKCSVKPTLWRDSSRKRGSESRRSATSSHTVRARRRSVVAVTARNRILVYANELSGDGLVHLVAQDARAQHLTQVLKVQPGDAVKLGIVNGAAGTAEVLQVSPNILLRCQQWQQPAKKRELHLILAMPRPKILKRLWATLACLGVTHIHITGAEKVEAAYYGATVLHPNHILPQLIVGAEQAGDIMLPAVFFSKSLRKTVASVQCLAAAALSDGTEHKVTSECLIPQHLENMLAAPRGNGSLASNHSPETTCVSASDTSAPAFFKKHDGPKTSMPCDADMLSAQGRADPAPIKLLAHVQGGVSVQAAIPALVDRSVSFTQPVVLAVGPEGGWVDKEIDLLVHAHDYRIVTLAFGRTLDTTTAVIALVSLVGETLSVHKNLEVL